MIEAARPALPIHVFRPAGPMLGPPLVIVHGRSTDPIRMLKRLARRAAEHGRLLVAPDFRAAGISDYQRLGAGGAAADALDSALESLAAWRDIDPGKVDLFGFSAGAQFVHRYALDRADRVHRFVAASAGWWAWPDIDPFPDAFFAIPSLILVGDQDVRRGSTLRRSRTLDEVQGMNRLERARRFVERVHQDAAERGLPCAMRLVVMPGVGHAWPQAARAGGIATRLFDFLDGSTD